MAGMARVLAAAVVATVCVGVGVQAFSQGAPDTTCGNMEPVHGQGITSQTSQAPYTITPGAAQVSARERLEVTLESNAGEYFKGFLIQGRSADSGQVTGTFFTDHKYLNCDLGMNNAVTHKGSDAKTKVTLMWEPKSNFTGDVVFKGTFVRERPTYWVGVTSEKVTVNERATNLPTITTPTPTITTQPPSPSEIQSLQMNLVNIYDQCGTSKGCFGMPPGCENSNSCRMMVTYTKVSSGYRFEIMGPASSGYVAAGLSDDDKMGEDSVMACRNLDGMMDVVMAHNTGKSNLLLEDLKKSKILSEISTLMVDGKIYCKFVRRAKTEIMGSTFDLENDRYHVMLAMGRASSLSLVYHSEKQVSSGLVSMSQYESVAAVSELFLTLHASLMVGAWVCAASCGIIIARYYKKTWLKSQCCGIDQWFHLHRLFMGLTWGMTMAALGLIVYYVNGWTTIDPRNNPHAILGIISTGLCFIQPFMALCRCGPNHKRRPVFNWLHWLVGNCAQILAITAIFFGMELVHAPEWTTFILIIFIAFHCMVHLILSVGQCVSDSRADKGNNVYPMKEVNGSRNPLQPTQKKTDAPGAGFRKAMLAFYFFINWLITAVLLLIIIVGETKLKSWGLIFWEDGK